MRRNRAEAGVIDGLSLALAGGQEKNLLCSHNISDAHGVGLLRNLVDGGKEACVCLDGALSQVHAVSFHDELLAGLIEADVSVAADSEKLQVNASHGLDLSVVVCTGFVRIRLKSVWNVGARLVNVYVIE